MCSPCLSVNDWLNQFRLGKIAPECAAALLPSIAHSWHSPDHHLSGIYYIFRQNDSVLDRRYSQLLPVSLPVLRGPG